MWLIDTKTLRLHDRDEVEKRQSRPLKYAILSHRWEKEEVSFKQVQESSRESLTGRKGWKKIQNFCALASSKGYEWSWVDTCCIDKSSSAELSEAINSMFNWYRNAAFCCIYLSDVSMHNDLNALQNSKWFTRGWTLQELLAPFDSASVTFYSEQWHLIGSRRELAIPISHASGIPPAILRNAGIFAYTHYTVAQRMSWASKRVTSRPEDVAYCLLGLFEVNMPLLYGEGGSRAFERLQHEIISNSHDESIFAWNGQRNYYDGRKRLLASSPSDFAWAGSITHGSSRPAHRTYMMTNRGLQIQATLIQGKNGTGSVKLPLDCSKDGKTVGLVLYKSLHSTEEVYIRENITVLSPSESSTSSQAKDIVIQKMPDLRSAISLWQFKDNKKSSVQVLEEELKSKLAAFTPASRSYSEPELFIFNFCRIRDLADGLSFDFVDGSYTVTSVPCVTFYRQLKESILEPTWVTSFLSKLREVEKTRQDGASTNENSETNLSSPEHAYSSD